MNCFYAGIFIIDFTDWMVLATSDSNHPTEVKAVGGMSKDEETPKDTVVREAIEEARTQVQHATMVCAEQNFGRNGLHTRYFYLADQVTAALEKGATWEVEEKDPAGVVQEKLTTRWVTMQEFADKLFVRQYSAFGAVLAELSRRKPELMKSKNFLSLMRRFPEPADRGLDL